MFDRFTPRARQVIVLAQEEARRAGHPYIGTEHLVLGLLLEEEGIAARTLRDLNSRSMSSGNALPAGTPYDTGQIPFTPHAKHALEAALATADRWRHPMIGTEHVLAGVIDDPSSRAVRMLADAGSEPATVAEHLFATIGFSDPAGEAARYAPAADEPDE